MIGVTVGALTLTRFAPEDTADLHRVRNHPSVRRFMADPRPIPWPRHVEWVRAHLLEADDLLLFLVRQRGEAIGLTLLRRIAPDTAEIGVMVTDPDDRPLVPCYATVITLHWAFERLGLGWLVSWVVPGHERALALNRAFGGWDVDSEKPGMVQFRLSREVCLAAETYRRVLARLRDRMVVA
jgi:RimJ/RimL family protein N-acetyltransferase